MMVVAHYRGLKIEVGEGGCSEVPISIWFGLIVVIITVLLIYRQKQIHSPYVETVQRLVAKPVENICEKCAYRNTYERCVFESVCESCAYRETYGHCVHENICSE